MNWKRLNPFCLVDLLADDRVAIVPAQAQYTVKYGTQTRGDVVLGGNILVRPTLATAVDNNNQAAAKVDVDNDGTTNNSSSAVVRIPAGATVLSAQLYWQSRISAINTGAKTIRLSTNGTASGYQTVTTSDVTSLNTGGNGIIYAARADVTNIIRNIVSFPTTILAGGAQVEVINDSTGSYAGWGLVIAYQSPGDPIRQLRIFDGFASVSGNTIDIDDNGFSHAGRRHLHGKVRRHRLRRRPGYSGRSIFAFQRWRDLYRALATRKIPPPTSSTRLSVRTAFRLLLPTSIPTPQSSTTPAGMSNNNNSVGLDIDRVALSGPGTFFNNNQTSLNLRFHLDGRCLSGDDLHDFDSDCRNRRSRLRGCQLWRRRRTLVPRHAYRRWRAQCARRALQFNRRLHYFK